MTFHFFICFALLDKKIKHEKQKNVVFKISFLILFCVRKLNRIFKKKKKKRVFFTRNQFDYTCLKLTNVR